VGYVSRFALGVLALELERIKKIGFDISRCGCVLRQTYDLPYACELTRYNPGMISLQEIHVMWTRLTFSNVSSSSFYTHFLLFLLLILLGSKDGI